MNLKKIISAALAAVCCLSLLSGCKGADTPSAEESSATEPPAVTSAPEVNDEINTQLSSLEFTAQIRVGWNIGNTLDATGGTGLSSETSWGNPKITQELILAVKDAGFNAVRIPTTWGSHIDENNTIDEEWMSRVQEVVDYAYKNDMFVILNMHHEDWNYPYEDNKQAGSEKLTAAWTQIAERFKGYDEHLIFEGMNEPRWVGTGFEWNGGNDEGHAVVNYFNQVFVDAVRATGGNNAHRFLMVCPYAASSSEPALAALELPDDDRVIVSVHAYTPYSFALKKPGTDKWLADRANCTSEIDNLADVLDRLFISKGTAVIIGECGAMNKENEEYRAQWAEYYMGKFKSLGIPCFLWDNGSFYSGETFGLINRDTLEWRYPLLMEGIMKGAGE